MSDEKKTPEREAYEAAVAAKEHPNAIEFKRVKAIESEAGFVPGSHEDLHGPGAPHDPDKR